MARFFARRPFGYGRRGMLDRGQVFEMEGLPNDEKLTRLGYAIEYTYQGGTSDCGECGAQFTGDAERAAHGSNRHRVREMDPTEEDARIERQERMLDKAAPLFYENTKASQEAGQSVAPNIRVPEPKPVSAQRRAPRAKRETVDAK